MSKRKLLLADDSVTIQKVINLTFADEGIDVVTCGDGDTALEKIASESPDLIMVDVHMPGANGYRICESVRANAETAAIPVILLVGSFEPFDENEALRVGASTVMTKPFSSIRQLVNQVMELLEAARKGEESLPDPEADIPTIIPNAEIPVPFAETPPSPEMDDIDSLYHQSFSDEPRPYLESIEFRDVGLDDEIVETTYPNGMPEQEPADTETPVPSSLDSEETPVSMVGSENETLEMPAPVFKTADEYNPESTFYDLPESGEVQEPDQPEIGIAEEMAAETGTYDFAEDATEEPVAIEDIETIDFSEIPTEEPLASDDIETIDFSEVPTEEPEMDRPEISENPYETGPLEVEEREGDRFEFDEIDLLDLPKVGDEVQLVTAGQSSAGQDPTRAVSLSPELMDIIVERVIERLKREN